MSPFSIITRKFKRFRERNQMQWLIIVNNIRWSTFCCGFSFVKTLGWFYKKDIERNVVALLSFFALIEEVNQPTNIKNNWFRLCVESSSQFVPEISSLKVKMTANILNGTHLFQKVWREKRVLTSEIHGDKMFASRCVFISSFIIHIVMVGAITCVRKHEEIAISRKTFGRELFQKTPNRFFFCFHLWKYFAQYFNGEKNGSSPTIGTSKKTLLTNLCAYCLQRALLAIPAV